MDFASEIALSVGLIGGAIGLMGLVLASVALTRVSNLKEELRRSQSRERSDRAALRAEMLALADKREETAAAEAEPAAKPSGKFSGQDASPEARQRPQVSTQGPDNAAHTSVPGFLAQPPAGQRRTDGPRPAPAAVGDAASGVIKNTTRDEMAASQKAAARQRLVGTPLTGRITPSSPAGSGGSAGFEQFLGTKMLVWLGGLALALAMGFFVHHAFKNNWVTPEIRLIGGAAFCLVLLGCADFVRAKADAVAQAMSGAGIAGLYTVIYSANHFYGFIGSPLDFLLSVVVTAAAVVLALRHGPFTAVLGMLGGFVMPVLLRTGEPAGGTFFGYLILLQLALVAVGRRRHWRWLSVLSLVFGTLWGGMSALNLFPVTARVWPEGLFFGMAAVYVFAAWPTKCSSQKTTPVWLGFVGVSVSLLLMLAHVSSGQYEPRGLGMLGLLAAAALILARLDTRFIRLPWAALAAVAGMLMAYSTWGQRGSPMAEHFVAGFAGAAGAYAAVLVLGAWACMWRSRQTATWAWFSLVSGVVVFGLVLAGLWDVVADGFAWWALAAGMAALYTVMATPRFVSLKRSGGIPELDPAVGVWAVGSALFAGVSVALAGYDDMPWMRLGWAALALMVWAIFVRLGIAALRGVVLVLTALVGICVIYPGPFFTPLAETPVWNELLLGYGGSAVVLGVIAWWTYRRNDRELSEMVQGIGLVVVLFTPAVLIRHGFVGDDWEAGYSLYESATHAVAWLALGIIYVMLGTAWRQRVIAVGGALYGVVGTLVAVVGSGLILNPLWNHDPVGTGLVFNGLIFVYLMPALLALGLGVLLGKEKMPLGKSVGQLRGLLSVACLLLVFAWVSLNVRQGFVGPVLHLQASTMTSAEWYAYSVAWVALGALLLLIGVITGRATSRWGSLALMMLAVVKVFIFDAAELRDLYRVLSFLGLGFSLIALGYVYQRFVFKKPDPPVVTPPPDAPHASDVRPETRDTD